MKLITFSCRYLALLVLLSLTNLACANPYSNNELDWAKVLQLSSEQQQQIKIIENDYRTQHKNLKSGDCLLKDESLAKASKLKQLMHQDIHNILTHTQKQQAAELIQTQHRQMQLRRAREMARELNMDSTQRLLFLNDIDDIQFDYQWPFNVEQRERARALFEQVLEQHLNAEQHQQWQDMPDKLPKNWHKSNEFQSRCAATTDQLN